MILWVLIILGVLAFFGVFDKKKQKSNQTTMKEHNTFKSKTLKENYIINDYVTIINSSDRIMKDYLSSVDMVVPPHQVFYQSVFLFVHVALYMDNKGIDKNVVHKVIERIYELNISEVKDIELDKEYFAKYFIFKNDEIKEKIKNRFDWYKGDKEMACQEMHLQFLHTITELDKVQQLYNNHPDVLDMMQVFPPEVLSLLVGYPLGLTKDPTLKSKFLIFLSVKTNKFDYLHLLQILHNRFSSIIKLKTETA